VRQDAEARYYRIFSNQIPSGFRSNTVREAYHLIRSEPVEVTYPEAEVWSHNIVRPRQARDMALLCEETVEPTEVIEVIDADPVVSAIPMDLETEFQVPCVMSDYIAKAAEELDAPKLKKVAVNLAVPQHWLKTESLAETRLLRSAASAASMPPAQSVDLPPPPPNPDPTET
jgi:hypothetical protein